jgi:hypothetical protein
MADCARARSLCAAPAPAPAPGYKAAGDVATLQRLAAARGLACSPVGLVAMSQALGGGDGGGRADGGGGGGGDAAPVSSSKARAGLTAGCMPLWPPPLPACLRPAAACSALPMPCPSPPT